jgi:glycosyltransferase involved in cell wall biosynthesis
MVESPRFSVIIPARNRPGALANCLQALTRLEYPIERYEVIVVDDASEPPLRQAVEGRAALSGLRWERLSRNEGPAAARNHGARIARGRFLAFTDDDCQPAPEWLNKLEHALNSNPGCAVGGRVIDGQPHILYSAANQALLDVVYEYYNTNPLQAQFVTTANLAVPATSFLELDGFNAAYRTSEDREFCSRWLASGRPIIFAPEIETSHFTPGGFLQFWRRHYSFGEGAFRYRKEYTNSLSGHIRLEPLRFYWRLVSAPLDDGLTIRSLAVSFLICLSQAASALGLLSCWRRCYVAKGRSV